MLGSTETRRVTVESRGGIKPAAHRFANSAPRQRFGSERAAGSAERGAGNENRTRFNGVEARGPTIGPYPQETGRREAHRVEPARLELASPGCKPRTLPLRYGPKRETERDVKESNPLSECWKLGRSP